MNLKPLLYASLIAMGFNLSANQGSPWECSLGYFKIIDLNIASQNVGGTKSFQGTTLGVGYAFTMSGDATIRLRAETAIVLPNAEPYMQGNTSKRYSKYSAVSGDYIWKKEWALYIGVGAKILFYEIETKGELDGPLAFRTSKEPKINALPEFLIGWRIAKPIALELNTAILYNSINLRIIF